MENQPLSPEEAAKKAKSKAAHRASMIGTGAWMLGCGLIGAYLVFSKGGDLPGFMYGHWRRPAASARPVSTAEVLAAYAKNDPAQAKKVLDSIEGTLSAPDGGYYLSASDRSMPASSNGAIAAAVFGFRSVLGGAGQPQALKTLELWWAKGVRAGVVRHELSSPEPAGLPQDQLALAEAFAAAFEATREPRHLERARAVLAKVPEGDSRRVALETRLKAAPVR